MNFRALCPHCDRVSRYSGKWQGRQLVCGNSECGRSFTPQFVIDDKPSKPAAQPAAPTAASNWAKPIASRGEDFEVVDPADAPFAEPVRPPLATPTAAPFAQPVTRRAKPAAPLARPVAPRAQPVVPLAWPVSVPFAAPVPSKSCPCCGNSIPIEAILCTNCGTNQETGRRIVPPKPWDKEEERDELAHGWLRIVSLLMWVAPFLPPLPIPYASEAPVRRRPTALLVIVGLAFLLFPLSYVDAVEPYLPLWAGDPSMERMLPDDWPPELPPPPVGRFHWWQLFTHQFMHGDADHVAFNMLMLLVFGPKVNDVLRNGGFASAFLGLGAIAGLAHMYQYSGQEPVPLVGASGACMVVTGMYAVFCPQHFVRNVFWVRVFVFTRVFCVPYRLRGIWLVLIFVGLDVWDLLSGSEDNVAHGVHFVGFVAGALVAIALVLTRAVNCGGYDLLSWCFGQQEIQPDLALREPGDERWSSLSNHPAFLVAYLAAVVIFALGTISKIFSVR